jgi:hypothetical protein
VLWVPPSTENKYTTKIFFDVIKENATNSKEKELKRKKTQGQD